MLVSRSRLGALAALAVSAAAMSASAQYTTLDFSSQFNLTRNNDFAVFPTGAQTFSGVPFAMGGGPDVNTLWGWASSTAVTGGPATLTVPVNVFGVTEVYSLMNTFWGTTTPGLLSVTFNATNGVTQTFNLTGNSDVRDYLNNVFTNSINNTTTINIFSSGATRLDMQRFTLNPAFANETLLSVSVLDGGANGVQRVFVTGLTVNVVPAPGAPGALAGLAALGLAAARRRR
ncbi:hypothetical protein BH11PLA1_BH11PLA1_17690 [soil metagenome]